MKQYDPKKIEAKWQKFWEKNKTFEVTEDPKKEKFYSLIEFPYPSAAGLHVGHSRPFTAMDVISRKKRMEGFNVLYPIGFDAFGLPTENYAIKTGRPPAEVTAENIATFTRQLKSLGYSLDWSRSVDTTDPEYYRWTQWIFLQFYKHGLAYKKNQPINWCPKDKIGLANEEVVQGCCERCGTPVEQRNKEQWMLAITKYADKLLEGLKEVDYIAPARIQQENWIGKSEGAEIDFALRFVPGQKDDKHTVRVFTTRPDTIFGATFVAVSAELAQSWLKVGWQASEKVKKYVEATAKERVATADRDEQEKTGVDTGIKAVNPANGEEIPVWVTNYVMGGVGTGAIMGVPAHDERDFEFAKKVGLPIHYVIRPEGASVSGTKTGVHWKSDQGAFTEEGVNVDSDFLNDLKTPEAKEEMTKWLEEKNIGKRKVNFKLRDWVFSRQRYWGEPIPLVFCENCKNKKQKVLLIHGFTGRSDKNWHPWMKRELEKQGFEVFAPTMTTTNHPVLEKWLEELAPFVKQLGEDDVIVGHSLGGKTALHILEQANKKIGHLYLVAPVILPITDAGLAVKKEKKPQKDYPSVKDFWNAPLDWKKIQKHILNATAIFSDDDPSVPFVGHEVLPADWSIQKLSGYQHFTATEIPVLLENILKSKNTGWIPLPESELPLKLLKVAKYEPTDTGESPLAAIEKWVNTKCPRCGGKARRETDTMPNWAGSSWYFLRYCDPKNKKELASMEKLEYWMGPKQDGSLPVRSSKSGGGVDWYNGGMEHTVLHLLYSRFWNEFLFDIGMVPTREPYKKRTSHGMILGPDGEKMSKSRGNVINPDEMVEKFGTDAFRMYIMFMGPFDQAVMWDTNGLVGVRRFLDKVWHYYAIYLESTWKNDPESSNEDNPDFIFILNKTIKKVTEDIEEMKFNTAISALMEFRNYLTEVFAGINAIGSKAEIKTTNVLSKKQYESFLKLLSPFAPHLCEEIWSWLGHKKSIAFEPWPEYNPESAKESYITLAVQINGKVRDTIDVASDASEESVKQAALASEKVQKWLEGKEPKKVIYVKGKLVSVVV